MIRKILPLVILAVGVLYVFTHFSGKQAQAFAGARQQLPIRLYRGRSNYRGTLQSQQGGYQLSGNRNQQRQNNRAIKNMKRSGRGRRTTGKSFYSRNGIPVNPQEQRNINAILTRQRRQRGWS